MNMRANNLKRKDTKKVGNEDVQNITPLTPKKKEVTTAKIPWKENVKVEENEESGSKNWKGRDVETMIL
jgi:hypothetical protein